MMLAWRKENQENQSCSWINYRMSPWVSKPWRYMAPRWRARVDWVDCFFSRSPRKWEVFFVLNMGKQFERLVFKKERMAVGLFRFYVKWGWIEADLLKRNVEICDILFIPSDICWVSEARLICNSERLSAQMKAKTLRWSPAGWLGRNGRASPMGFFSNKSILGGGFKYFVFSFGEDSQFD